MLARASLGLSLTLSFGLAGAGAAGCQRDSADAAQLAQVRTAYGQDIQKLCDVVTLAGAADLPEGERQLPIANWLAANLTTPESRQFLVHIQPLTGERKAQALEAEAQAVGLPGCALAAEWRTPTP